MIKKKIEKIVDKKKKQEELRYFDKYAQLFHDAYRFLAPKKALLYGGTALNEILPATLKIYDPYTLPDIDVLSPQAEKLATQMVKFYKKTGHQAVSFTEALHSGTYKVYADGVQIADITQCDPDTYHRLLKGSIRSKQWKIKIVPPQYIRMTLHKIMAQPNDAHRWENVYDRLNRFYKAYPISCQEKDAKTTSSNHNNNNDNTKTATKTDLTTEQKNVMDKLYKELPQEVVYFGKPEIEQMLNKKIQTFYTPMHVLTNRDVSVVAETLMKKIPGLKTSRVFSADHFVPRHVVLTFDKTPIAIFYQPSSCVAFNEYKKKRVATINAVIDFLLSMSLTQHEHFKKDREVIVCVANKLSKLQQKGQSGRKLLKQFVDNCYGPILGLITMRRERAKRIRQKKKGIEEY